MHVRPSLVAFGKLGALERMLSVLSVGRGKMWLHFTGLLATKDGHR